MASIKKYETAKGHAWRVQYRSPDGRSRTKQGFRTKAAAQAWADKNATLMHEGQWINPAEGKKKIADYHDAFFATKAHLANSSLRVMRMSWAKWVEPEWGRMPVASVRKSAVQAWLSAHADQPVSVRRAHGVLAGILDLAVDDRAIAVNPARGVSLPRKPEVKQVYLTEKQLVALAEECGDRGGIVMLLGTTGLRWGELAGLQVGDVPDVGNRIKLVRTVTWTGGSFEAGVLKGRESRVVSVPESVMEWVRGVAAGRGADEWLFGKGGVPARRPDAESWFAGAVQRLVSRGVLPERITPHGLRHVAAGLMIGGGANVLAVQRQLGHKDASVTLNTYASLWDQDLDAVGAMMEQRFSDVVGLSWAAVS